MLTVTHGPFSDLEPAFIARLKELAAQGVPTPVAVVAPSRRMADRLERLAAVEHGMNLLGVQFHTFHSLAAAIIEEGGLPDKKLISDPVFHDRLVDGLLAELPALANFFGGEMRPKALAAALRSSLRDLIDAGVSATELDEHFGSELLREAHDRERLGALLALGRAYEKRLEKLGVMSSSGLTRLAAERAEDSPLLDDFKEVLYYGFYDLTGLQLDFFEAVAARRPARLYFPYREGHPAFRFASPFFDEKLRGHEAASAPASPGPALAPALDRLFGSGSASVTPDALKVISASGARDEAWAASKEILSLVEARGYAYEDIGIAARTLEPYRDALAEVLAENSIPFEMGAGEPLLGQPLAKSALNLLGLRRRDFPAAVVEDLFCSPYFIPALSGERRFRWRRLIRVLGVRAGWLQWRGKLEGRAGEDFAPSPDEDEPRIPKADVKALWDLVSGLEKELRAEETTWSALADRAASLIQRHLALGDDPTPREREAWEAVLECAASLAALDLLGEKPAWDEFLDSFERKLRARTLETADPPRAVRVMDAMDARGQSFKALIVLGLKEKLFPRMVSEDPILREPARAALRHPAGYWIARKSAGYEEERLLFYLTAAAARERLICVYPRSDEAGKAQVPSLYLRELCRAAGRSLEGDRIPRQPAERLLSCEARLLSRKELSLREALSGALPEEEARRVEALDRFGSAGEYDGIVGPPEDHLKRLRAGGLSPSALDEFARCPFQYFADRVLGLGAADEGVEKGEFAAWVRGKIYHAVLERFYAQAVEGNWEKRLSSRIEEVFAEYGWTRMGVYPVLWLSAKQMMSGHLREFVAWDLAEQKSSGLSPLMREEEVLGEWPGPVPKALEGLRARGVIDRVDCDPGKKSFRIVDYKSRWKLKGELAKHFAEGNLHQLPLYAELAARKLPGAEPAGLAIYSIEGGTDERAKTVEPVEWIEARKKFFAAAAEQLESIASGRFMIKPDDGDFGYCRFCEFSAICRKSHAPSRARAAAE